MRIKVKEKPELSIEKEKRRILSLISHGIRTPLNSIVGFSKLLLNRDLSKVEQKEYASRIVYDSNILLQFIGSLIDENEILKLRYSEESINLNRFLWEFSQKYQPNTPYNQKLRIVLVWDSKIQDFMILSDPKILEKLMELLLDHVVSLSSIHTVELGFSLSDYDNVSIKVNPAGQQRINGFKGTAKKNIDNARIKSIQKLIVMLKGRINIEEINALKEIEFSIPLRYDKVLKNISV